MRFMRMLELCPAICRQFRRMALTILLSHNFLSRRRISTRRRIIQSQFRHRSDQKMATSMARRAPRISARPMRRAKRKRRAGNVQGRRRITARAGEAWEVVLRNCPVEVGQMSSALGTWLRQLISACAMRACVIKRWLNSHATRTGFVNVGLPAVVKTIFNQPAKDFAK